MAKNLSWSLFCVSLLLFVSCTHQLQSSHTQVLLQLKKQLQDPKALDVWNTKFDFCYTAASPSLTIACEENSVTELRIVGDKPFKASDFEGLPIPGQTLPQDFSIDSFVTTLARLPTLKVVCLVSLGIWGPLSDKIHRLYALEVLDLSANYLYGSIPPKISAMTKLQTLTLDSNFFNETLPDWFDSLSNLTYLSIKNNRLTGSLPETMGRIRNLTIIALPHNNLTGNLPDLSGLSNLQVLDLRENELSTELPTLPRNLVTVLLSDNSISGDIPTEFGEMDHLQHLDLSSNLLHGTPPQSLFSLKNISYINLASNQMSGPLPKSITCGPTLGFVDISSNRLEGGLPPCLNSGRENRVVKFDGNCLSVDVAHQHPTSYCQAASMVAKKEEPGHKDAGLIVGVIVGILAIVIVLALGFLVLCKIVSLRGSADQRLLPKTLHDNSPSGFSSELMANVGYLSQVSQRIHGSALYRLFTLNELKAATNNFDEAKILGNNSAGKLYKGRLENGTYVAIRRVALSKKYSIRNLKLRLDLLSKLHHPNLVYLLGHCLDSTPDATVNGVYLIYEYVVNANLHLRLSDHVHGKALKWSERLGILTGVAKAVHFLHSGVIPGLFNNRLKSSNVLVDEHLIAKISDYGLSLITEELDKAEAKSNDQREPPFVNQSYAWDKAKSEDDIYSFGLILLETLIGCKISESEKLIPNEVASSLSTHDGQKKLLDPMVLTSSTRESLSVIISITTKCISPDPSARPSMEDVVWNLQYAAQIYTDANGDQKETTFF